MQDTKGLTFMKPTQTSYCRFPTYLLHVLTDFRIQGPLRRPTGRLPELRAAQLRVLVPAAEPPAGTVRAEAAGAPPPDAGM